MDGYQPRGEGAQGSPPRGGSALPSRPQLNDARRANYRGCHATDPVEFNARWLRNRGRVEPMPIAKRPREAATGLVVVGPVHLILDDELTEAERKLPMPWEAEEIRRIAASLGVVAVVFSLLGLLLTLL